MIDKIKNKKFFFKKSLGWDGDGRGTVTEVDETRLETEFSLSYGEWNDWFIFDEKKLKPRGCWAKTVNKGGKGKRGRRGCNCSREGLGSKVNRGGKSNFKYRKAPLLVPEVG